MSNSVLVVDGVGKCYRNYRSELQRFASWFGIPVKPQSEHWVLRHISFRIGRGEAVGLVGQNGAGKSTLLKIITGTVRPNEGSVVAIGRISALLELGLGFNAELTGRENSRHALGLMGAAGHEIESMLESIEEFAEIGDYFDQPIRAYSSGMQMRVAFSVATAVRPETLIVDEALSVGDSYFVHKCFKRIREFREAGTTLLIVSHDAGAIQALCDRALLIEGGRLIKDGDPQEVMDYYNALIAEKENASVRTASTEDGRTATESGTGEAVFDSIQLLDETGNPVEYIGVGDTVTLRCKICVNEPINRLVLGYMIKDRLGQPVFGTNTHHTGQTQERLQAGDQLIAKARFPMNLGPGTYSVSVALASAETHLVENYHWRDLALVFNVANIRHDTFVGTAWIPPVLSIEIPRGGACHDSSV
ncbi:ABC transporter ATP-binding protein [Xanthomonas vasicola]|uniref:ABC transporter ATP-binding protein n=1 Tax=Xanthomonas vasicola TaxID=56459 RepID=A0ABD7S685_XANVA|nr:ABC transporter ATP-binding protein [Xanthomonas vasicola]AZR24036.1 ABC transporter ATP-binding protein [Xanthomonas vasicola]KGR47166.1 sugar ABC transporter ATP-binding protein [Xanthomonas vasicola]KGR62304.1 sugar ABC transporter ATP-binding protein [Xanthomonas vasicola]TWQ27058.1 ABC transporter ATP-binding protein [Xanthomonas vasicola]TWQ41326.1 ABC transporter ATP-binding protein [Xanthomonas vasicola]